jgi:hypothetical protein
MKCRDRRLGEPEYYNKRNFEMIFEQNARFTDDTIIHDIPPIEPLLKDLAGLFARDADWQTVFDGFMLQDADFENMTVRESEDTIARLRREAETRKARAMANQAEAERRAAGQAFGQIVDLLGELEKRLLALKLRQHGRVNYRPDEEMESEI